MGRRDGREAPPNAAGLDMSSLPSHTGRRSFGRLQAQVSYALSALSSISKAEKPPARPLPPPKPLRATAQAFDMSLPEMRISQLSSIFPDMGLGYLELALACYTTVEATVEALTNHAPEDLHPR